MSDVELVVARFGEDISWLCDVTPGVFVGVYDKGKPTIGLVADFVMDLANVGREAQTYLFYIVEFYDDLPKVVVFCQGNPHSHCDDFAGKVAEVYRTVHTIGFQSLCRWNPTEPLGNHYGYPVAEHWPKLFSEPCPTSLTFPAGAQFAVSRERILARPLAWYEKALRWCEEEPGAPWIIERWWPYIFGEKP